jgi:hypothetical protein
MTREQRERYAAALSRCFGGVMVLDAMLESYPAADEVTDDVAMLELEDLARRLEALTAVWDGDVVATKSPAWGRAGG